MDPNNSDQALEENLKEVIENLPPVIREYVTNQRYAPAVRKMVATYQLHVDQGTALEREILLLLLGIEDLDEFTHALVSEIQIEQSSVSGIVKDINEQIFIPLREELQNGPMTPPAREVPEERLTMPSDMRPVMSAPPLPPKPGAVPPPPPPRALQAATPRYIPMPPPGVFAPPPQSPRYPNQENANLGSYIHTVETPPPQPAHLVNKIPPPPPPSLSTPTPAPVAKPEVVPPFDASRLLEDHEESSPSLRMPNLPVSPSQVAQIEFTPVPRAAPAPAPAPRAPVAPQNLPGSFPPAPVPGTAPTRLSAPPLAPRPVSRPYTVDPYREPVDDGKGG